MEKSGKEVSFKCDKQKKKTKSSILKQDLVDVTYSPGVHLQNVDPRKHKKDCIIRDMSQQFGYYFACCPEKRLVARLSRSVALCSDWVGKFPRALRHQLHCLRIEVHEPDKASVCSLCSQDLRSAWKRSIIIMQTQFFVTLL